MSVVVLIEDGLPISNRLVTTLGTAGIDVLKAACPRSAVALANSTRPAGCTSRRSRGTPPIPWSAGAVQLRVLHAAAHQPQDRQH
jgi:hypothetical protein